MKWSAVMSNISKRRREGSRAKIKVQNKEGHQNESWPAHSWIFHIILAPFKCTKIKVQLQKPFIVCQVNLYRLFCNWNESLVKHTRCWCHSIRAISDNTTLHDRSNSFIGYLAHGHLVHMHCNNKCAAVICRYLNILVVCYHFMVGWVESSAQFLYL